MVLCSMKTKETNSPEGKPVKKVTLGGKQMGKKVEPL